MGTPQVGSIGVVGLGTVGAGVAALAARAGVRVTAVETDAGVREQAKRRLGDAAADVAVHDDLAGLGDVGLVVVAVPLASETHVLAELVRATGEETVLAVAGQGPALTPRAVASSRPGRVVGAAWAAPVLERTAVEVVTHPLVDTDAVEAVVALASALEVTVTRVADRPGAVVARLLLPYLNDAVKMVEAGYASREDVDAAMRFGCGHPVGPLALLDAVGLDAALESLEALHAETGLLRCAPAPLLRRMVTAGAVGRDAGRGFYTYAGPGSADVVTDATTPAETPADAAGPRPVRTVGVVGTGTMATGIAEVCARAGYDVVLRARSAEKAQKARGAVEKSLGKQVDRGRLEAADRDAALGRLTATEHLADLAEVDLVVEAVVEDLDVKTELFAELGRTVREGAVLATTTSSLPVAAVAAATDRPADVVGMHWFNPAPVMKLVEVVPGVLTAPDVLATVEQVCRDTRKVAVRCGDRAGFVVNALLFPYLNDAVEMLATHYADVDTVDAAVVAALGHPMGPFALVDVVGTDVTLAIEETLHAELADPGLAPEPLLGAWVAAGYLGRKSGRGVRDHRR